MEETAGKESGDSRPGRIVLPGFFGVSRELAVARHKIFISGPKGEKGGENDGVNRVDDGDMEHDPTHRDHLGGGADFPGPVGVDGNFSVDFEEDDDAAEDFEIAGHDEDDEPDGEVPILAPVDHGRGDEPGHEKGFIGDGVEDGPGEGLLVEVARDPAVDSIEHRGQGVN